MCATGIVFDIQRAALHDGPGLRTVVFLKGCPLRCLWCHNPESQSCEPETGISGKTYGRTVTVSEVMRPVLADRSFYASSGGGLTVSGGEPTLQHEFCLELLRAARAEGIHTCLDTSGAVSTERLDRLAPFVSLFLYDYKATGAEAHRTLTGVADNLPCYNLQHLLQIGAKVRLRCPLIPGVNDTDAHLRAIGTLMHQHPEMDADIMPYHETGNPKYAEVRRTLPALDTHPPREGELRRWRTSILAASGGRLPELSGALWCE